MLLYGMAAQSFCDSCVADRDPGCRYMVLFLKFIASVIPTIEYALPLKLAVQASRCAMHAAGPGRKTLDV